jgi:hypothetical protein
MSEVRIHHKLGVPRCLFQLRSDRVGITWHAIDRIPIDLMNLSSSINSSPRGSVTRLLAVEDLGRGSSGKAWLTCTVSKKPSICVLKFCNHESASSTKKLMKEKDNWDLVYPEFKTITSVGTWSGSAALKMPHFCTIPKEARDSFRPLIEKMMQEKFSKPGVVHCDVKWRNIGYYTGKNTAMDPVPVLYDLESVRKYSHDQDEQWIENAMMKL